MVGCGANKFTPVTVQIGLQVISNEAGSFPQATFASLKAERIGEAYGFASRIFYYQWLDDEIPQSLVVKLWDTDSKAGIGEILFYQTFPDVGTRVPIPVAAFITAGN